MKAKPKCPRRTGQRWCGSCTPWSTAAAAAKSLQACPTLCDPIDGSPPGSPVPELLQARTLEYYSPIKRDENTMCSNMDGPGDDHAK